MASSEEEVVVVLGGPKPTPLAPISEYDEARAAIDAAEAAGARVHLVYKGGA